MEIPQNKLNDVVCVIKFIIILDNFGKRIYSKYYTNDYNLDNENKQFEFERKLSYYTIDNNVEINGIDIFNYLSFNIISNISPEVIIFIGSDEDNNEVLLSEFYNNFEKNLINLVQDSLTRKNIYKVYQQLIIVIDEMVNEGLYINSDSNSIERIVNLNEKQVESTTSSILNMFTGKKEQNENNSNSLFGNILSGAKNYLTKTMNY
jgi:hypothetical protein